MNVLDERGTLVPKDELFTSNITLSEEDWRKIVPTKASFERVLVRGINKGKITDLIANHLQLYSLAYQDYVERKVENGAVFYIPTKEGIEYALSHKLISKRAAARASRRLE